MMDETGAGMFLISNVRNFTFEGIVDPMITDAIEADMGLPIKYDKFGWFYPVSYFLQITCDSAKI